MGHRHLHWPASTATQYHLSFSLPFLSYAVCLSSACLSHPIPLSPFLLLCLSQKSLILFLSSTHVTPQPHIRTPCLCHMQWSIFSADCFTSALAERNESGRSQSKWMQGQTRPHMPTGNPLMISFNVFMFTGHTFWVQFLHIFLEIGCSNKLQMDKWATFYRCIKG